MFFVVQGRMESLTDGQRVRLTSLIKKVSFDLRTLWLAGSISESFKLLEWACRRPTEMVKPERDCANQHKEPKADNGCGVLTVTRM